jgi:preprotein translocase subunit YajC
MGFDFSPEALKELIPMLVVFGFFLFAKFMAVREERKEAKKRKETGETPCHKKCPFHF